jgi:hypothetical protein
VSGNTCKLALKNSDITIQDITVVGSGTCSLCTAHTSTATATVNVLEDVTSDAPWSTTALHDRVVLVDALAPEGYDQQRVTLDTINAGSLVLSANVNSAQWPGARVYLSSRNVSIRSTTTSTTGNIVVYIAADTHGGVFQCEIVATAGTGVTFYGYGINNGRGHTISGAISGCRYGVNSGAGYTISGIVVSCYYGVNSGTSHTVSGDVVGCYAGVQSVNGATISGIVAGCRYGVYAGIGSTISGTITGCNIGVQSTSGLIISGTVTGCAYSFYFPVTAVVKSGANVTYTFGDRNIVGCIGRVSVEDYDGTGNAYKAHAVFGDIIKTACDGTGDAPSVDPDAGNGYCVEASNIQSNLSAIAPLVIIPSHRIWMTAEAHTVTYKVQTTYAGITAGNLKLWCSYISTASPVARTITSNAPAISQRSDDTDWTQTLAVTFTPAAAGWVDFSIELYEYEAGNEVYVWPTPTIS